MRFLCAAVTLLFGFGALLCGQSQKPPVPHNPARGVPLSELVHAMQEKAKSLESSSGMRLAFQSFTRSHQLSPDSLRYSDFTLVRLFFESTRDAGLWNMHWSITDQPPNSDSIWRQWKAVGKPSLWEPAATAECDELSALFAFLVRRAGVKDVGLFWPYSNHTVAVWTLRQTAAKDIRVVVPTSQVFLTENDLFDTKKFDPWQQKTIYEYTRRDVPDSFELSKQLADFFLLQVDKYAGATDVTLQHLRYLRDAVLNRQLTPEQAASKALAARATVNSAAPEDLSALETFAADMRREVLQK